LNIMAASNVVYGPESPPASPPGSPFGAALTPPLIQKARKLVTFQQKYEKASHAKNEKVKALLSLVLQAANEPIENFFEEPHSPTRFH